MKTEHFNTLISLAITVLLFYLFYNVLKPFFEPVAWAMVLSITFYPAYKLLLKFLKRPWLASVCTVLIIIVLIIGPFAYVATALVSEMTQTYVSIEEKGFTTIAKIQEHPLFLKLSGKISAYGLLEGIDLRGEALNGLKSLAKNIGDNISELLKNAVFFVVSFVIMCLTIFYFLKDGEPMIEYIKRLLPFSEQEEAKLWQQIKEMVIAAIYGGVTVAIIQGTIGGIAFLIFGLPSPVFWGAVMAVLSLVPLFGTAIIWMPAGLILISGGEYLRGAGLLLVGFLIISMIDNILKPLIIGSKTKLHTLLIFFSVLGGISYFGFIGFILGPLIAALCLSVLEIFTSGKKYGWYNPL